MSLVKSKALMEVYLRTKVSGVIHGDPKGEEENQNVATPTTKLVQV